MNSARVSVALDVPLRQVFDYRLKTGEAAPAVGARVRVSFGRRELVGIVWPSKQPSTLTDDKLKFIGDVLDKQPLLDSHSRQLVDFAARYYHQPIGEVVSAALPPGLRAGKDSDERIEHIALTDQGRAAIDDKLLQKAPKQHALLSALADADRALPAEALQTQLPGWRRVANSLLNRGLLEQTLQRLEQDWQSAITREPAPLLTDEQQTIVQAIIDAGQHYAPCLLDGVTGSGKTEVFLQLIAREIDAGRQTLVLVPEIGLTPQLVSRFERRLGRKVALLHSGLAESERTAAWLAARDGRASIVLGTRSTVFVPLANPGLIIVDEEHDSSLKQHEGFRYHARDLAVWRARQYDVPLILSTATPSLESLHNANQGRYRHFRLSQRAGEAAPPAISVIDTNRFNLTEGVSQPVIDAMRKHLDADNQVMIYLNRRGFAPTLICSDCGNIANCNHCDAHMTLHAARNQLQCHHCGARRTPPSACGDCAQPLKPLGEGTERVEEVIAAQFPDVALARIDSDTTMAKGSMQAALAAAKSGESRILIGTQMLAKGHHLPKLTLVVILNADQGFFASDFRASERLAQSIVQVAGRAGRADQAGQVLIQTAYPDHRWLRMLVHEGYAAFAEDILSEREQVGWPPFKHIAVLHAASSQEQTAINFLHQARQQLNQSGIECLGPAPASMLRRAGRYRYQLLLTADHRVSLQSQLGLLTQFLDQQKATHRLRWSLDVDPQSEL